MMQKKIKKCIIPRAGMGTRFLPATKALPKEMFPIIDKPIMQILVEEAFDAGCEEIIIITGKNKRAIEDHFDSNYELESKLALDWKIEYLELVQNLNSEWNIVYIRQHYPIWDGDAILRAKNLIWDEPFLVLFWDDIVDHTTNASRQLVDSYQKLWSPMIATVNIQDRDVSKYGILESNDNSSMFKVSRFLEKPSPDETTSRRWSIWKYILTPDIFKYLEDVDMSDKTELRLADGLDMMARDRDVYGVCIEGERFDTGSKMWFLKATIHYALKDLDMRDELILYMKEEILKNNK